VSVKGELDVHPLPDSRSCAHRFKCSPLTSKRFANTPGASGQYAIKRGKRLMAARELIVGGSKERGSGVVDSITGHCR
jgi:hypothetical protein